MIERYDTTILQTKTATRMVQVIRKLVDLMPVTKRGEVVAEAEKLAIIAEAEAEAARIKQEVLDEIAAKVTARTGVEAVVY